MTDQTCTDAATEEEPSSRRDFLQIATITVGAVGTGMAVWPIVDSINPPADVLALASSEIDISSIEVGQSVTVIWRGRPVFVRHRTEEEVTESRAVSLDTLPDPQSDEDRTQKPEWLIMVGVCTHLGCVPLGQQGEYNGWFCPCHGSHYDTSGRIRIGPAPLNLEVPAYDYLSDDVIKIG